MSAGELAIEGIKMFGRGMLWLLMLCVFAVTICLEILLRAANKAMREHLFGKK